MMILAPSILAADFKVLGKEIEMTEKHGAEYLHFDVMDGMFVPSISFGMPVLQSIRNATNQICDVHLMIKEPVRYIEAFEKAGADIITIHYEACDNVEETLDKIIEMGLNAGISICPDTPVSVLQPYLKKVQMVLIMSVHPGFGGQTFIPESLDKIKELKEIIVENGLEIDIQVDGGIYQHNVRKVLDVGANIIVAGSAVFNGNVAENTKAFVEILNEYN